MNIIEIYEKFPTEVDCIRYLEKIKWGDKPQCPYCDSTKSTPLPKEYRHHCNHCNTSYSVTVKTIFHRTHLPLQKWFLACCLVLNAKKGISSRQLARDLKISKDTAWSMQMRIRRAMNEYGYLLEGILEMDECYVGVKWRRYFTRSGG
jgi:transposase-like protein